MQLLGVRYIRFCQDLIARISGLSKRGWVLLVAMMLLLAGCPPKPDQQMGGISKLAPGKAQEMNAENSRFETSKDPPITAETHFAAGQLAASQGVYPRAIEQYNETLK